MTPQFMPCVAITGTAGGAPMCSIPSSDKEDARVSDFVEPEKAVRILLRPPTCGLGAGQTDQGA
jgi:hypothetical protein